jgi:hypothetical protein
VLTSGPARWTGGLDGGDPQLACVTVEIREFRLRDFAAIHEIEKPGYGDPRSRLKVAGKRPKPFSICLGETRRRASDFAQIGRCVGVRKFSQFRHFRNSGWASRCACPFPTLTGRLSCEAPVLPAGPAS